MSWAAARARVDGEKLVRDPLVKMRYLGLDFFDIGRNGKRS
jgi:hypothetical protein